MLTAAMQQLIFGATPSAGNHVKGASRGWYPWKDNNTRETKLARALFAEVTTDTGESHVVVVSFARDDRGVADYTIWCGDKFLETGRTPDDEAQQRCASALERARLPTAKRAAMLAELLSHHGTLAASAKCDFWQRWRRDESLCGHTSTFLHWAQQNQPNFLQELADDYDSANLSGITAAPKAWDLAALAFKVPVLFEGERGSGKTYEARAFARTNGFKLVAVGGHAGIEAPDLLGYLVPFDKSRMVWKDGALAEAFRAASREKVVLLIDELLRIPQRELSVLLTALSPDEGMYRLRTGRIAAVDADVAIEEELSCPVENLCVIATTNVGSEYAVDESDLALAERFVILRKDSSLEDLKRILQATASAKMFGTNVVEECCAFYTAMQRAQAAGLVKNTPSTRTLARAVSLAESEQDVVHLIRVQMLLWVARDLNGRPIKEQLDDVEKLIQGSFVGA